MRKPSILTRDRDLGSLTPMIDVVFLLLIFFVVTASSQLREWLLPSDLSAPGTIQAENPVEADPLTIDVTIKLTQSQQGNTLVDMNGTLYPDLAELRETLQALAELGPENPVYLDIAGDVPLGPVVHVYDTCQAAGFLSVNFLAGE